MPERGTPRSAAALVVAIGAYQHCERLSPLRFARRDAKALARMLTLPALCGFPSEKVTLLSDRHASRDQVVRHLSNWLPTQAKGADVALVFFAGHGTVQAIGPREEGFLLPYDADPDDIVTRGIAMSDVARWMDAIDAAAVVLCLDCCHAGKVVLRDGANASAHSRDMEIRPSVLQSLAGKGRFLIASCAEGQKSLESEHLKHGLFTYHLLRGIAGHGDRDGDGKVGVAELFTYVSAAVAKDAREEFGRAQNPWTSSTWTDDVYVSFPAPIATPPRELPPFAPDLYEATADSEIQRIDQEIANANEAALLERLKVLRRKGDPVAIPAVFRCLVHPSEVVRRQARKAIHRIGWEKAVEFITALAHRGQSDLLSVVLEGLAAFEAHAEIVQLLDRLLLHLRGELRMRAILLLERKRLVLELSKVTALFEELRCPYRIDKVLGQGLFTSAYLAHIDGANLPVAVRVLRPEFAGQPAIRAQFMDLSHRSLRFIHQNLALTREARAFPERQLYYVVRDYVEGITLQQMLQAQARFPIEKILDVLKQVLRALTPIHEAEGHHGGIKPSNIFLDRNQRVILGDPSLPISGMGLALERLAYDYRYAPPESFRSGGVLSPASDLYALGCVAHELVCGRPPYISDNYLELAAAHGRDPITVPAAWTDELGEQGRQFLSRLLATSPAERFTSIAQALREIDVLTRDHEEDRLESGEITAHPLATTQAVLAEGNESVLAFSISQASLLDTTFGGKLSKKPDVGLPQQPIPTKSDQYEIIGPIARGGMGAIYKAKDKRLGRVVALKILPTGAFADPEALRRFQREARVTAQLQHSHIASIYDVGEIGGQPYLTMPYVEGGSLQQHLKRFVGDARAAATLMEKIARAVHYAHQHGILHRDLKPGNILLDERGEPLISDFGLAKLRSAAEDANLTIAGQILGTPAYMSPEQARGEGKDITTTSDIWSLGVIFYQLLTGKQPFTGGHPAELMHKLLTEEPPRPRTLQPHLDRDLETICLKCLQKNPAQRYPTAEAFADDLARWLRGISVTASPRRSWRKLWPW